MRIMGLLGGKALAARWEASLTAGGFGDAGTGTGSRRRIHDAQSSFDILSQVLFEN
jgi:hypothetical protein